jgi:hypothetical protein
MLCFSKTSVFTMNSTPCILEPFWDLFGTGRGPARPGPARLGSARLGSARARLGSARLGSARLGSARLGSAPFGSVRLGSARLRSARPGSARLGLARPGPARLCSARLVSKSPKRSTPYPGLPLGFLLAFGIFCTQADFLWKQPQKFTPGGFGWILYGLYTGPKENPPYTYSYVCIYMYTQGEPERD